MDPDITKMFEEMKDYFDEQIKRTERHCVETTDLKFNSLKEATSLAKENLETRLNTMNEFRGALKDNQNLLFTKSEHELYKDKVDEWMRTIDGWKNKQEGKADQSAVNVSLVLSVIGILFGIIGIIMRFLGM